jgi:IS30 family transposase
MLNAKMPVRKIATEIGRHRSTIYRDIKRNGFVDEELPQLSGYYGMVAQETAQGRRACRRKLVRLVDLRKAVITQLKEGWSPEQISGRLKFEGQPVCVSQPACVCKS